MIQIKDLNKVYENGSHAVKDFNLDIHDNEFVVFVGPSGCGKSTTLRMIAGLEDISKGTISIDDKVINDLQPKDRNIAMVFQNYALYPHMTVYKNLAFGLKMRGIKKRVYDKKIQDAAKILEIENLLQRKPKALSGGQRQRVALGRAIVRDAQIFLMDEPLSNLDAKLRSNMRSEIIKIHKEMNATTIYVTHDQTEAMTMASRIVILNQGEIQQIGTPEEIYRHPVNEFVATFIGSPSMNIIPLTYHMDAWYFDAQKVADQSVVQLSSHSQCRLGIRPEDLHLITNNDSRAYPIQLTNLKIDLVELTGSYKLLHCHHDDHKIVAAVDSNLNFELGQNVSFGIHSKDAHYFHSESGERMKEEVVS
ncbi:spermidine/putrescine ABC transporter ATP-binding protein [Staphylococcus sp. TE8]|uniref:ABC transporter ATP-binding protein n=1 Tax=Staphylococcus sp. TE8 TaxID=1472720 RepID=UPI0004A06DFC|nr:sn-glycerol-3-phosphate ABC transporter ATP-binding protein UgpC [Staphylococcus sp. TE8]KDE96229.1 spermidine/putrescine ABC transporter ATP-binding protein [Staphylococcus sp. TE8]